MSYVVLARKWRPLSFDDLIGQEHVTTTLANAIAQGRVAHAFLFTGVRGVGKTTSARILAKALNCANGPTAKPCLKCNQCVEITEGRDLDVQEIDGATYTSIDDIRDLQEKLPYRPSRDRFKIFIVDEVHMLSKHAWNAFLKTLEEPPSHVKFIFATTEVEKVPITILSRCQRYDFKLISATKIAARLRHVLNDEKISADDEALSILAREAAGSMRDAMSLLDQVIAWAGPAADGSNEAGSRLTSASVSGVLGVAAKAELHKLASALVDADGGAALRTVAELADQGFDMQHLTRDLLDHVRDLVVTRVAPTERALVDVPDAELAALRSLASRTDVADLSRLHQGLARAFDEIAKSVNSRAALEMTLVRLAARPPLVPVNELVKRLVDLEARLGGGGGGGQRGPAGGQSASGGEGPGPRGGPPMRAASTEARSAAASPAPLSPGESAAPSPHSLSSERATQSATPPQPAPFVAPPQPAPFVAPPQPAPFVAPPQPAPFVAPPQPAPFVAPPAPPAIAPPSPPVEARYIPVPPSDPRIQRVAAVVEVIRRSNPSFASVLERAHIVCATEARVAVAFDPRGFEMLSAREPGARALFEAAVREKVSSETEAEIVDLADGVVPVSLARVIDDARRSRRADADHAVRQHPLVLAAERELGAEVREIRLPAEADISLLGP